MNTKLQEIVNDLYKSNANVGSGSTAAAVRHELLTGKPVKGKIHIQKAQEHINRLVKWIKNNPTANPGDRAAAENLLTDLKDALGK